MASSSSKQELEVFSAQIELALHGRWAAQPLLALLPVTVPGRWRREGGMAARSSEPPRPCLEAHLSQAGDFAAPSAEQATKDPEDGCPGLGSRADHPAHNDSFLL